ncbi:MAG: TraR/DksA family transcriptional regulator [Rhizobiaceae bacterium]|nr:TraR/DksA family transcriptional regulator [Rhizobiaceae bacterium]
MIDIGKQKARLLARQAELRNRLTRIEDELDEPVSIDSDERAVERQDDEVLEAMGEAGLSELRGIEAALERIAHGRYGICARCGEDIAEARLEAVPHAALCQACHAEINA